ncbi:MAG: glycosyl hydrolase family 65 protein [Verrucomicrobiota bacterium]
MALTIPRVIALLLTSLASLHAADILPLTKAQLYIERFNADDREVFSEAIPNAKAWEFLAANIPLFECPDSELERTYYFRWWSFRKHLKQTPAGWIITEFLPKVSWSNEYNAINCASAHHIREGRWLKDQKFVHEYLDYWLTKGGRAHGYSFWVADSVLAWCDATGDYAPAKAWLPALIKNYVSWETTSLDPVTGMFFQWDGSDGMEGSIGTHGFRPTINSYMYGDALAIARIAEMSGKVDIANTYRAKAEKLKQLVQARLWNEEHKFFEIRRSPWGLSILRCWLNNDAELTKSAKITSSAAGSAEIVKGSRVPVKSSDPSLGTYQFGRHLGTEEWLQYELPTPTELSSVQVYLFNGGIFVPPDSCRVYYRKNGEWKVVADAKGEVSKFNRWNTITFSPVLADALKIEFKLNGTDRNAATLSDVRELIGYVPWCFDLPDSKFGVAWKQILDPRGFAAPFGLTTAEQRHPEFAIQYDRHECMWNGPIWPFATAQTLTGLANYLNREPHPTVTRTDYLNTLSTYAHSHRLKLENGETIPWIDEDQNPLTGDWIARTCILNWEKKDPKKWQIKGATSDRGKDYNHSTFCDLVINGLIGLRPRGDDVVEVNPLVPEETWEYFCLDRVPYHGRSLTILWDKTGVRYHKGPGLRVLADGNEIAHGDHLGKTIGKLP